MTKFHRKWGIYRTKQHLVYIHSKETGGSTDWYTFKCSKASCRDIQRHSPMCDCCTK